MLALGKRETEGITDPAIPALAAVLDPLELHEYLRALLPTQAKELRAPQVRVLRHHAGKRCVVEISYRTAEGSYSWIGKVYAKDQAHVYRLMEEIRQVGFGPREEFSIPEPIAYLPGLRLLLQEKVPGRPATESFLSDRESERNRAAERCARWLAKFHGVAPRIGSSLPQSSQMVSLERWYRRVASVGEPFAGKAEELFKRLEAAAPALQRTEMGTIHGDYTHHQSIFAPGRTVTVDWDDYHTAELSQDVARFIVGLQRLALRRLGCIRALDDTAEVFLKTYLALERWAAALPLTFQRAAICMEHAKHDVHKQARGWQERAATTLDEGLRVLEQRPKR